VGVPQGGPSHLLSPTTTMSMLPFPADSAEFEEYTSVMQEMADEANANIPDPEPSGWTPDEESDELREAEDEAYWASLYEREGDNGREDSYLDSYWEEQSEYGMEGCCGDF